MEGQLQRTKQKNKNATKTNQEEKKTEKTYKKGKIRRTGLPQVTAEAEHEVPGRVTSKEERERRPYQIPDLMVFQNLSDTTMRSNPQEMPPNGFIPHRVSFFVFEANGQAPVGRMQCLPDLPCNLTRAVECNA